MILNIIAKLFGMKPKANTIHHHAIHLEHEPAESSLGECNNNLDDKEPYTVALVPIQGKEWNFPERTKKLLYLTRKPPEEYLLAEGNTLEIKGYIISIHTSFVQNVEPSVISSKLPISEPRSESSVEPLSYWPRYDRMTSEQRWIYLKWLTDITRLVDIGYVFTYYYGLERHLLLGDFEDAAEEILLLQEYHRHKSFLRFSSVALTVAMYIHKREDYIERMISKEHICDYINPDVLFLFKADRELKLTAKELMLCARKVGFTNTRYIKAHPEQFEKYLQQRLLKFEEKHGKDLLGNVEWKRSPKRRTELFANLSLGDDRFKAIPCITQKKAFASAAKELLQEAHNEIKSQLATIRKADKTSVER